MNEQEVERAIREGFSRILKKEDGIFRAEKKYNEVTYQVCYVDTSQHLFDKDFDLDDYQRQLIMEDYYSLDGAIQWNFYLYFLVDEERTKDKLFEKVKHDIEVDKKLARKFILTLAEFEALLSTSKSGAVLAAPLDLVGVWKGALSLDLADVFDESIAMNSVVAKYLDKEKKSRAAPSIHHSTVKPFPLIRQLKFIKYRDFPILRNYEFGRVNLIYGPNAVGKTSLLEAVELAACGKTIRNSEKVEKFEFKLLPFNSDNEITVDLQNETEYRSRDHHWYGRNYTRGNDLHMSFARFNYFDADAAVRFSERVDEGGGIGKMLTQVVFGPDADRIFQRIEKIKALFETELKNLKSVHQSDQVTKGRLELELQAKTRADAEVISQDTVKLRLQTINILLNSYQSDSLEGLIRKIGESSVSIAAWNAAMDKFGIETYASFEKTISLLKNISIDLGKLEILAGSHLKNENAANELAYKLLTKLKWLERLREYEISGAKKLPSLIEQRNILTKRVQSFEEATRIYSKIDTVALQPYVGLELTVAKEQGRSELTALRGKESEHRARLQLLKNRLDQTSLLITEIKSLGVALVEQDSKIDECPLCGTDLKPSTLASKLEKPLNVSDSTREEVDGLIELGAAIAQERAATENRSVALEFIVQSMAVLKKDASEHATISQLLSIFEQVRVDQSVDKGKLEVLERDIAQYTADHYSVSELNQIERELGFGVAVNGLLLAIETRITECKNELERINLDAINERRLRDEALLKIQEVKYKNSELVENISAHTALVAINNIQNWLTEVNKLGRISPLSSNETISSISSRLSEAKELVSTYLRSIAEQESLVGLRSRIAKIEEDMKKRDISIKLANKGFNNLSKTILEEKPEKYLTDFLSKYADYISIIFDQIHSPREFSGIVLEGKELYVLRISNNSKVSLSELSTGQRTALVLSVFLAMNKAIKHGPRALIFDDPVAYVDDLNVLSFLDYLQKLAIEDERQIFFTTANQRIATLFAKKFDFLALEHYGFKKIKLSRLEYEGEPLLS
jgi:exonuclease SbcC